MKIPGGMDGLFRQAQAVQERIEKEIRETEIDVSVGGEMVTVRVNGNYEFLSVRIKPEIVKEADTEMLEDLVLSAVNEASKRINALRAEKMKEMTGGLDMGSLQGLLNRL
jgi:nucleoid-associated protein EbfC